VTGRSLLLRAVLVILCGLAAIQPWGAASALDIEFSGRAVKREILALYDSRHEASPQTSRIHQYTEMPLNWLGYKVKYHDVNQPLPSVSEMAGYRGILTWFIEPMAAVETYLVWLDRVTAAGTKLVVMSELVPNEAPNATPQLSAILGRLGLAWTNQFVAVTHRAKIAKYDTAMLDFERPIDKALPDFVVYKVLPGKTTVHLSVLAPLRDGMVEAAIVTTNAAGGYASDDFAINYDANSEKSRWSLNPFRFFKAAFGDERFPVPDVTTVSGRRMYFSHIDGDGWNNVSEIEAYREAQVTSAEVIRREAIEPFPDLPISVGVIAGDVIPDLGGTLAGGEIARKIFALPQVEVASHTYTHPFNWGYFETYSRLDEEVLIEKTVKPTSSPIERLRSVLFRAAGKTMAADKSNKYIAGSDALPRTYLKQPFDLTREVQGALSLSESLAPPGKKAMVYMWSGNTTPFEAAIAATRQAGVRNINGGDSRLDKTFPSIFYVPPISRPVGKERQIFAVNSNENTYTNDWLGPYYGFFMLQQTLDNTETPRRLKPFNLYYHMYSGEKAASLAAIKHFVTLARNSNVIPVTTSRYAGIADDFFGVEIEQVDVAAWLVKNRGTLSTVRFDAAELLEVDGARSTGVIGANRHQGSLYLSLDPSVARALVTLRPRGQTGQTQRGDPAASLVESRWSMSNRQDTLCGIQVEAQGFGPGQMVWSTQAGRAFRINIERRGTILAQEIRWADAAGFIKLEGDINAQEPVSIRFDCHE
jgi:polysaccharide biosynthesis protein PelA